MRVNSFFIKKHFRFIFATGIFILTVSNEVPGIQLSGSTLITGKNYESAVNFLRHNRIQFNDFFPLPYDSQMASAIVFPELIRYSYLRDVIEITALKALYVQYGSGYSDFSIGPFR
jgi:hypothetical protein